MTTPIKAAGKPRGKFKNYNTPIKDNKTSFPEALGYRGELLTHVLLPCLRRGTLWHEEVVHFARDRSGRG